MVEQNLRILMKQEHTKDQVRLQPWAVLTITSQRSSSTGFTPHQVFLGGRPTWFFSTFFPEEFKSAVGDWLEHKQSMANQAGTNLKHVREHELSRPILRQTTSVNLGDLVLLHHSRLPSWPRNCLQDPHFGRYRIIRIDGSRIHLRCSPRLGGELLFAPKQSEHYHSADHLIWDEWRLSDKEVKKIDLQNAASPEGADQLEEMIAGEMAVHGYYVMAGIARHEYKQGWKFPTLPEGFRESQATWEPISAFIQPHRGSNPVFCSYLVENNEGQLLTCAETLSQRKKKHESPCAYLFIVFIQNEGVASFTRRWYTPHIPSSHLESHSGPFCRSIGSPRRYTSTSPRKATLEIIAIPPGRFSCLQPNHR